MRYLLALIALAGATIGIPRASAAPDVPKQPPSIEVKDVPLRKVVAEMAERYCVRITVAAEVPDLPITASLGNEPLDADLSKVLDATRSRYMGIGVTGGPAAYAVRVLPYEEQGWQAVVPDPPDTRLARKVTLKRMPLRDALAKLLGPVAGCGYVVDEAAAGSPVDLPTGETSAFQVLLQAVEQVRKRVPGLWVGRGQGIYFLYRPPKAPVAEGQPVAGKRTIGLNRVSVGTAVGAVMAGSTVQYTTRRGWARSSSACTSRPRRWRRLSGTW